MAENKQLDIVNQLTNYKKGDLGAVISEISEQKSRLNVLIASIKAKRESLAAAENAADESTNVVEETSTAEIVAQAQEPTTEDIDKAEETEAVSQAAVAVEEETVEVVAEEAPIPVEEKAEEAPAEEAVAPIVVEEAAVAEVNDAPAVEQKAEEPIKEEAKVEEEVLDEKALKIKRAQEALKNSSEVNQAVMPEILPNGEVRRVYIPPTPAPKKPRVQTRVFEPGYNPRQRPMGPRPTTPGAPSGAPGGYNRGPRPNPTAIAAQAFPPKPGAPNNRKGKNGKSQVDEKSAMNKRMLMKKGYIVDNRIDLDDDGYVRGRKARRGDNGEDNNAYAVIDHAIITTELVPIKVLSAKIGHTGAEIIKQLFLLGIIKTINESVDFATAELVSGEFNVTLEYKPEQTSEDTLSAQEISDDVDELDKLESRPPVITIMGHVDHGKTSLLDYIRKSDVAGGEAGGITQAIGAYTIKLNNSPITFLDTPGHEAFTAMRARGSQVTDIAILVVAADDGIMPQTIESINHARNANVPIIVAVNKIDKNGANPDRVMQQLTEYNLVSEEWGGETPVCKVSAKTGEGVQNLLENILTMAEVLELKANPHRTARGSIIEARLDKGKGPIATILVQKGTLHVGDVVVAGTCSGKIRAMLDDKGKKTVSAGPSIPVSVTGFSEVPEAGDPIIVVSDEKFAKDLAAERKNKINRKEEVSSTVSLADIFAKIKAGELKSLELIIKADVQGSVEAVAQSLGKLGNEEVKIEIIHSAVGAITENDVNLASTAHAIIIGFNVRADGKAKALAEQEKVDIRYYSIIYDAIDDIEKAVKGMLAPKFEENILGSAEVREVFRITGVGAIAGCHVTSGKITRGVKARLIRDGAVLVTSDVSSLRHNKDDAKEIKEGYDCGIQLTNYQDIKQGDVIEAFTMEEIAQ